MSMLSIMEKAERLFEDLEKDSGKGFTCFSIVLCSYCFSNPMERFLGLFFSIKYVSYVTRESTPNLFLWFYGKTRLD